MRVFVSFALVFAALASAATADSGLSPAPGRFIVADHSLVDPNFAETVVLIIDADATGALGLVVNRPTEVELREVLPQYVSEELGDRRLYFGGPVSIGGVLLLVRSDGSPTGAEPVFADVYVSSSASLLESLVDEAGLDPAYVRVFAGYAGWAPGQLEAEIARGDWHVLPALPGQVFSSDEAGLWQSLVPPEGPISAGTIPAGLTSGAMALR